MSLHLLIAAEEATESAGGVAGLFSALGLNVSSLLLNTAAFLIVVWVMAKWVFPPLTKALDAKTGELEAAVRLEREAKAKLDQAADEARQLLAEARQSADEVLASAKADAAAQLDAARTKAAEAADRTVAEAREQIARDVLAARQELKTETAKLVAGVTEAVLGEKLDEAKDGQLIKRALEGK